MIQITKNWSTVHKFPTLMITLRPDVLELNMTRNVPDTKNFMLKSIQCVFQFWAFYDDIDATISIKQVNPHKKSHTHQMYDSFR